MAGMDGPLRTAPAAAGGASFSRSRGSFSVKAGTLHEAPKVIWAMKSLFHVSMVVLFGYLMWINDTLSVVGAESIFHIKLFIDVQGWLLLLVVLLTHIVEIFAPAIFESDDTIMKAVTIGFAGYDVVSSFFGFLQNDWFKDQLWLGHSMAAQDVTTWATALLIAVSIAFVPDRIVSRFAWLLLNHLGFGNILKDFN